MEKYHHTQSLRTLEITVISGEDLRINKRSIHKNAFVIVRSDIYDRRTTAVDTEGGSYPRWDEKLSLDFPSHAPALTIEVQCRTGFGTKVVGTASVPASDFSGGYVPESYLHFLSYRLRDSRGQRNGIINISIRTTNAPPPDRRDTCSSSSSVAVRPTIGLRPGNHSSHNNYNMNSNSNNFGGGGVVTGIPVWNSCQRNF